MENDKTNVGEFLREAGIIGLQLENAVLKQQVERLTAENSTMKSVVVDDPRTAHKGQLKQSRVAVNWEALGEALGGNLGPFTNDLHCYTARSITDTRTSAGGTTPSSKFANAHAWIQHAYDDGVEAGVREERERWRNKIVGLFGV